MIYSFLHTHWRTKLHWLFIALLLTGIHTNAQTPVACNEFTADMGYTVQSVTIKGRWLPKTLQQQVEQIVGLGGLFDPAKVSTAETVIRDECIKNEGQFEIRLLKGSTSVLNIYSQTCDASKTPGAKEVAVVIYAYYLRIDLINIGNNMLPVPRSARPSFYDQVPILLKATAPMVAINSDRNYGSSMAIKISTDLLNLPGNTAKKTKASPTSAILGIAGRKSFTNSFYSFGVLLELNHPVYTDSTMGWNVGIQYNKRSQPLGKGENDFNSWNIRGGIQGTTQLKLLSRYAAGAGVRLLKSDYSSVPGNLLPYDEKGIELYALADGKPGKSFTRMGIWFDAGIPNDGSNFKNYQRLVSRIGYSIFLGSGHNNVLMETIAGAGYTWGSPPANSQYFAGNIQQGFLYQPLSSVRNLVMQTGPLLRSLGESEGGLLNTGGNTVGGTSFWHLNFNFSIPISKWAKPLIPDIIISEEPKVSTLRTVLKAQAETAKNFIYDDLVTNHNYPDTDATDSAASVIVDRDIRPALRFLADRANVYSIKPLLLFDISHLGDHTLKGKTFTAAGIGIQLTVVIARLELGYMRTLSPAAFSSQGNFFLHFVLQNFY